MKFENEFTVAASEEEVWAALMDIERVTPCLPGARVVEKRSDSSYAVTIKVKLGPVTMNYAADLEVEDRDDAAHTARMKVAARETRGQGNAEADVAMSVEGGGEGTRARIVTDLSLTGRAASMGQSLITDVSAMLVDRFAANLAKMLSGEQEVEPAAVPDGTDASPPRAEPPPITSEDEDGLPVASLLLGSLTRQAREHTFEISLAALILGLIALLRSGR